MLKNLQTRAGIAQNHLWDDTHKNVAPSVVIQIRPKDQNMATRTQQELNAYL